MAGAGAGAVGGALLGSKTPGTSPAVDTTNNPANPTTSAAVKPGTSAAEIAAANPQGNVFKGNVPTAATDPRKLAPIHHACNSKSSCADGTRLALSIQQMHELMSKNEAQQPVLCFLYSARGWDLLDSMTEHIPNELIFRVCV